ncbi:YraN family protein [Corynebacterium sp. ES2794-CONJ1]|uniref:YraN family protein n=1 Tax=unclassified Corynebacterium TaxID=2624378 RepID=UPI002168DB18|nr:MULTISPECIES: YraN family protein [unclassified Corynebacterium]MCS4489088.1 YraN family protein [Corynebacterium sp. ES2775-CONJ]MCS4531217.1 YraN family protein [Corynebacterium sp. ES2730-CONJ]MCU9518585.1 YraN family protein [Corynebacterium sp. ES2794-CONJ1]
MSITSLSSSTQQLPPPILATVGENAAVDFLRRRGLKILGRNIAYPCGEIDIIAYDPLHRIRVVVEVKTRSSYTYGAAEAVDQKKLRRMRATAILWAKTRIFLPMRFDVITVVTRDGRFAEITWYRGVDSGAR